MESRLRRAIPAGRRIDRTPARALVLGGPAMPRAAPRPTLPCGPRPPHPAFGFRPHDPPCTGPQGETSLQLGLPQPISQIGRPPNPATNSQNWTTHPASRSPARHTTKLSPFPTPTPPGFQIFQIQTPNSDPNHPLPDQHISPNPTKRTEHALPGDLTKNTTTPSSKHIRLSCAKPSDTHLPSLTILS